MESTAEKKPVHQGKNVKLGRTWKNITQEGLAYSLNMQQTQISELESKQVIEDPMLEKIALALDVPFDFLKTFQFDEAMKSYEMNNNESSLNGTASDNADQINNQQVGEQENIINNYNYPIDDIKDLYNKLLEEKDKQIALFKNLASGMQQQFDEIMKKMNDK